MVAATRELLQACIQEAGLAVAVDERVGRHPSPTVLVDGQDVMGAVAPHDGELSCRLDVPTRAALLTALSGHRPGS